MHLCCTKEGSSGSPILSLKTKKVIGVHKAFDIKYKINKGSFLKYPINELNNEMKIIKEIKKIILK